MVLRTYRIPRPVTVRSAPSTTAAAPGSSCTATSPSRAPRCSRTRSSSVPRRRSRRSPRTPCRSWRRKTEPPGEPAHPRSRRVFCCAMRSLGRQGMLALAAACAIAMCTAWQCRGAAPRAAPAAGLPQLRAAPPPSLGHARSAVRPERRRRLLEHPAPRSERPRERRGHRRISSPPARRRSRTARAPRPKHSSKELQMYGDPGLRLPRPERRRHPEVLARTPPSELRRTRPSASTRRPVATT